MQLAQRRRLRAQVRELAHYALTTFRELSLECLAFVPSQAPLVSSQTTRSTTHLQTRQFQTEVLGWIVRSVVSESAAAVKPIDRVLR